MKLVKILLYVYIVFIYSVNGEAQIYSEIPEGTWIPVKQELGGREMPKEAFENQKLIISDSIYTFSAESVDNGTVKYDENKMDIFGKEGVNAGKHFTAIYKIENGQLIICYNLKGDSYPESFDTKENPLFFMSVFEKEK